MVETGEPGHFKCIILVGLLDAPPHTHTHIAAPFTSEEADSWGGEALAQSHTAQTCTGTLGRGRSLKRARRTPGP